METIYLKQNCVIVHPMTSYSGSVAYLKYVSLTDKGGVKAGDEFNSVFKLGNMTDARRNFTSQVIVETGKNPALAVKPEGIRYVDEKGDVKFADVKAILKFNIC